MLTPDEAAMKRLSRGALNTQGSVFFARGTGTTATVQRELGNGGKTMTPKVSAPLNLLDLAWRLPRALQYGFSREKPILKDTDPLVQTKPWWAGRGTAQDRR